MLKLNPAAGANYPDTGAREGQIELLPRSLAEGGSRWIRCGLPRLLPGRAGGYVH